MSEELKNKPNNEVIDIETKFKDIKSVDEINFDKISQMGRGKTPQDIEERCLQICKDYLAGNWTQQTTESITVRRITGGLLNQIYYCGINEQDHSETVPQEVAIRLYGMNIDSEDKGRIRDTIITLLFSEKKLGPKIYGLSEKGQVQKFYKHRQFIGEDQKNPDIVKQVFQKLAQIHSLELPLKKGSKRFFKWVDTTLEKAFDKYPINELINEYNCETLKKYDLKDEINWIKGLIERVNSPVVFTHNDFRSSNLMVTEPNDEVVVCDYDISGYGYRGNDFAALMREWGRKQFDVKTVDGIPLDSQFKPLIDIYVEECVRIHGKSYSENEINSVDHILKEVKVFLLYSYLFFTVIVLGGPQDENNNQEEKEPPNYKVTLEFSELNYKNYYIIKDLLRKQNIFD